ncbi:hypothetical protein D1BOALGB6SA_101 [Olavius sp. associated proteobacterium Delta 1]|nr:hypothetical protein D1BOALGB6SA_101 [Olavius sp. associated proteobacterium Delta 1]
MVFQLLFSMPRKIEVLIDLQVKPVNSFLYSELLLIYEKPGIKK